MLTPEEASEIANVSRITILRWLKRHDIGKQLDNGRWEIDPKKLAYLIAVRSAFKGRAGA
jgi:predicted site-specific integrase-resolvase